MKKVSIIIPAYNEEEKIENTLDKYSSFFEKNHPNYEILVIPNNCKDKTLQIVSKLSKKNKKIKFKEFKEAIGKSGALIEGFKIANGDLIGFTDADNSAPPDSFYKLVKNIKNSQGCIGSRWKQGADIKLKQPLSRRFFSRAFNTLVRLILILPHQDTQCGCKVFESKALKKILPKLGITNWAFDIDLLYQFKINKFKVKEIPITWSDDPRSSLNLHRAPIQMFVSLIRLRLVYSRFKFIVKYYNRIKDFLI